MNMFRILFCLAALTLASSSVLAQVAPDQATPGQPTPAQPAPAPAAPVQAGPNDADDARYQYHRVEDGYLRLDLRTGRVSLCSRQSAGWTCLTVPDDRAAFEQEIARLQKENVALKKALLERGLPLPGGVTSDRPTARGGEDGVKPPGGAELDRMIAAVERVWRRLVEMIASMQKDKT